MLSAAQNIRYSTGFAVDLFALLQLKGVT